MAHVVRHRQHDHWGETHGTYDTEYSLCGIKLNKQFIVLGTTMTHVITCKKCKKSRKVYLQNVTGDKYE
jgi:hypothetical protein